MILLTIKIWLEIGWKGCVAFIPAEPNVFMTRSSWRISFSVKKNELKTYPRALKLITRYSDSDISLCRTGEEYSAVIPFCGCHLRVFGGFVLLRRLGQNLQVFLGSQLISTCSSLNDEWKQWIKTCNSKTAFCRDCCELSTHFSSSPLEDLVYHGWVEVVALRQLNHFSTMSPFFSSSSSSSLQ